MSSQPTYFEELIQTITDGWNRFWFTAADPVVTGFLRLLTGGLLLWVLSTYTVADLEHFWGPYGFQSVETVASTNLGRVRPTFWTLVDVKEFALVHYACIAVVAVYAVGLFSRVTSVLATVIALSYFHRSPQLSSSLEPMLSLLLVYLCIAPSGASFSLDALLASGKKEGAGSNAIQPSYSATVALRLIQVHITLAVFMSALAKLRGEVWWEGSAVWWLTARAETRGFDFTWMHGVLFTIIEVWTTIILWFQTAFPIFIWNRLARPIVLALTVPVWVLVGLATNQYEFAMCFVIGSFAFLEPAWVRSATRTLLGQQAAERLCPPLATAPEEPLAAKTPGVRKSDANRRETATANA